MSDIRWDDGSVDANARPVMLGDIIVLNTRLVQAYSFLETCPPEVQEFLAPVIDVAADFNCSLVYQLGFDDPNELDLRQYIHMVYKNK